MDFSSQRRAFSLVEVIVALGIVVILLATMVPFYARNSDRSTAEQIATNLRTIATAILQYREEVGAYPKDMASLLVAPTAATTDLCGSSTLSTLQFSGWNGPYLSQDIANTLLIMETDTVSPSFTRSPAKGASRTEAGKLQIAVFNTSATRADLVEQILEGGVSSTSAVGPITWGTVNGRPQLTYSINIGGC